MSIKIIKAGMQTSIQDCGRQGLMHLGIASSGAMDNLSMIVANRLVGNFPNQPVLEICLIGPSLLFTQSISIAICGAKFEVHIINEHGKRALPNDQSIGLEAGDKLVFGKRKQGARAYLAFAANLNLDQVLDSYSTHFLANFGGYNGRQLQAGDHIELNHCETRPPAKIPHQQQTPYSGKYILRCTNSVETELFTAQQQQQFYATKYTVSSASNRMGLRLQGSVLTELPAQNMTSSGLIAGSIQIPPNGLPIISSVDGQTIGGYPRIANIISADLFALGQLVAGDQISFSHVDINQAHKILEHKQSWLTQLLD
jgi:biotin-dependent carboxylase-like uncharacterized protein